MGMGDEVIIPSYTFILQLSLFWQLAQSCARGDRRNHDHESWDLKRKLTPKQSCNSRTYVRFPANMDAIMEHKSTALKCLRMPVKQMVAVFVKHLGTWGHAGAFSFNDFKIITAGEGGALVTNDYNLYERALIYHDGGAAFRPFAGELKTPVFTGSQFRANEIMGAILRVQLRRLPGILEDLRAVKREFVAHFRERMIPSNDLEGDCGTTVGFSFATEEEARSLQPAQGLRVGSYRQRQARFH